MLTSTTQLMQRDQTTEYPKCQQETLHGEVTNFCTRHLNIFFILFRCLQPHYAEWQIPPWQRNHHPTTRQTEESQKKECAQKCVQNIMMCPVTADCL